MNNRNVIQQIVCLLEIAAFLLACSMLSTGSPTSIPTQQAKPTIPQPTVPSGWKLSQDPSGQCQVATPSDWELGRDFFVAAQEPDTGPFADHPGQFPPMGEALWADTKLLEGKHFQIRASLVLDKFVCSVWRIQAEVDFTDAEKSELEQVGETLQAVQ